MKRSILALLAACCLSPCAIGGETARIQPMGPACGVSPHDWCAAPAGDPCGVHADEASCRADARCRGLPYRGESVVACMPDGKGFWSNCPAVGCVSRSGNRDGRDPALPR